MSGEKKVEFRKTRFKAEVSHVVVYASTPVKKVLGYFRVSEIDHAPPAELWDRYQAVGGVAPDEFEAYFASSDRGFAIRIEEVKALPEPIPLSDLGGPLRAPQSFAYLTKKVFKNLCAMF